MPTSISIDSGSSFLKYFDGQRADQFPAVIERIPEEAPTYPDEIIVSGTRFAVGQTALMATNRHVQDPHIKRGFHGSDEQTVQMCYAFEQLGLNGDYNNLLVSLPYADHQQDDVRKRVLQRKVFEWQTGTGIKRHVAFEYVATTPQGVGALLYHRQQSPGYYDLATLVDIGSCTLDVVTVSHDKRINDYQFNHQASQSNRKVSVATFKSQWIDQIHDIDGLQNRNFGYHQLMAMPIKNNFRLLHRGDSIDLRSTFENVRFEFTRQVADSVRRITGDLWDSLNAVVLTGGGAQLIDLKAWPDDRIHLLDVFANVRGQYHAAVTAETSRQEVA